MIDIGEECDDGNTRTGDGCTPMCTRERPSIPPSGAAICGNDVLEVGEECDDGNAASGDGCSERCILEVGVCGDGVVQRNLGEQCDGPLSVAGSPFECGPDCRLVSRSCGNGALDPGEECDQGEFNSDEPNASCRTNCSSRRCGDGIVDSGEQCDDGYLADGDGCDRFCRAESAPNTIGGTLPATVIDLPGQNPSTVAPPTPGVEQTTDSGPAAIAIMTAGAAAGFAWMRRRRRV